MKATALIFASAILIITLTCCKREIEPVTIDSFLGEWYTVRGDFESYSFLKDSNNYIFVGTQNLRPAAFGKWKILKDRFIIISDNGNTSSYKFSLKNDTLIFNNGEQIYTRTEPLEVRFPEVKILITLAGDFAGLKFSAPREADPNWASYTDNDRVIHNPSLIGYTISAETTISSGVLSAIFNSLSDYGFEADKNFIKENFKIFRDGNQCVIVSTSHEFGTTANSITIHITSGYIPD